MSRTREGLGGSWRSRVAACGAGMLLLTATTGNAPHADPTAVPPAAPTTRGDSLPAEAGPGSAPRPDSVAAPAADPAADPAANPAANPAPSWTYESAPADTLPLRPLDGIRDPVFAILVGQALDGHLGRCDAAALVAAIRAVGRPTKLPLELLDGVTRVPLAPGRVGVRAAFTRVIDLSVPYRILTYHPGSFRGSQVIEFEELDLGTFAVAHTDVVNRATVHRTLELEDVRLYLLRSGALSIDIDGWLDRLAGAKLDDTFVAGMATFRWNGGRYGMALGYNRDGEARSGTLSFADDRLLYPNPPELKSVARRLRHTLETIAPELKPRPKDSRR